MLFSVTCVAPVWRASLVGVARWERLVLGETGGHNRADRRCGDSGRTAAQLTQTFESFFKPALRSELLGLRPGDPDPSPPSPSLPPLTHPLSAESRRPVNEAVLMCDIHLHEILMRAELLLSA